MSHNPSVSRTELMDPAACSVSAGGPGRRGTAHLFYLLLRIVRNTELVAPLSVMWLGELSCLLTTVKLLRTCLHQAGLSASLTKPMDPPVLLRGPYCIIRCLYKRLLGLDDPNML